MLSARVKALPVLVYPYGFFDHSALRTGDAATPSRAKQKAARAGDPRRYHPATRKTRRASGTPDVAMQRLYLWALHLSMITGSGYSNCGTALTQQNRQQHSQPEGEEP